MYCAHTTNWTRYILLGSFITTRHILQSCRLKVNLKWQLPYNIHTFRSQVVQHSLKPVCCNAQPSWFSAFSKTFSNAELHNLHTVPTLDLLSQSHIKELAKMLCCRISELKSIVNDHAFLIHMDLTLLETKMNLLLSYDLPLSFVKTNLRIIYQTSEKVLDERLKLLQDSKLLHSPHLEIEKVTHLLECNSSVFSKSLTYHCEQRDALEGCDDQLTYLQMRLGCTEQKARAMLNSYPLERHVSNIKLKTHLDFFLNEAERSPDFIITYRKLLSFSVSRLRYRWLVMQRAELESEVHMVYAWCLSQKKFEKQYSQHIDAVNISLSTLH